MVGTFLFILILSDMHQLTLVYIIFILDINFYWRHFFSKFLRRMGLVQCLLIFLLLPARLVHGFPTVTVTNFYRSSAWVNDFYCLFFSYYFVLTHTKKVSDCGNVSHLTAGYFFSRTSMTLKMTSSARCALQVRKARHHLWLSCFF